MHRIWTRVLVATAAVGLGLYACAVAENDDEDDARDVPRDDGGGVCDAGACTRTCLGIGMAAGRCEGAECVCEPWDGSGPEDVTADTVDVPGGCDPVLCDQACTSIGAAPGTCVADACRCGGSGPDADADVAPDEGGVDVPPADDGTTEDAPVEDAPVEDAPVEDTPVEDAPVEDVASDDAGGVWGLPVCDTTGATLRDRGLFGGATTVSRTITLPALGNGRVVRLEITIPTRRLLLIPMPFDDLRASLRSPDGTTRTFWFHFEGDTSGALGDYQFFTPWNLPIWWDRPVGGSWTLTLQDDANTGGLTALDTVLRSWCLTPLDPAGHSSTDTAAPLRACDGSSHAISDYACDSDGLNCEHPETLQLQVTELIRASATPSIVLESGHPDVSQLRVRLIGADGSESTVWNRGAGPLPSSIPLSLMSGAWMTGRYQLEVTDMAAGTTGSLTRWCIHAN